MPQLHLEKVEIVVVVVVVKTMIPCFDYFQRCYYFQHCYYFHHHQMYLFLTILHLLLLQYPNKLKLQME
jgi:hypothetical protein